MIQMAASFCADINGGYYYKPYTVESILDQDGNVVESVKPTLVRQIISEETSATVRRALEYAVTNGTVYGVQVADRENGVKMAMILAERQELLRSFRVQKINISFP